MEGLGSRMGRASSRYGSTAVFNGPVRRWKKKWVQVSSSPSRRSVVSNHSTNGSGSLLLCRWTPVSSGGSGGSATEEEPRRRKFRYTPIAVLDEQTKARVRKIDEGSQRSKLSSTAWPMIKKDLLYDKPPITDDVLTEEIQDSKKSRLDLDLDLDLELDLEEEGGDDSSSFE